jgi:hypothetical protein
MPRSRSTPARWLLAALALAGAARADVAPEARTPAEVYERRGRIEDCVLFVVRDLQRRHAVAPERGPPALLLVLDATSSLGPDLAALRACLPQAFEEGPAGLEVGVLGVGAPGVDSETIGPTGNAVHAAGAIAALEFLPLDGPKNLLGAVREGARLLGRRPAGAAALVLVTRDGGDAEDDVEATRDALVGAGVAFYAVAPEAAFERAWEPDPGRTDLGGGLVRRPSPELRRNERGTLYLASEVAYALVPYRWELDLAQTEFVWGRPPRWPVPSGFGYWPLATLAHSTGGRYFVFDFDAAALRRRGGVPRPALYDYGRLGLLAPDLRPRAQVLKDLGRDARAHAIVRIWGHLASEALPVVQELGALERPGSALACRPERRLRSPGLALPWLDSERDAARLREAVLARIGAVDQALKWWAAANARERTGAASPDPLLERLEADFQLLGVQLRKVRFHAGEALAALETIRPIDMTSRRVRVMLVVLHTGTAPPPRPLDLGDAEREARLAELLAAQRRVAERWAHTPWALVLERGWIGTFRKDVQILEEPTPERVRPPGRPAEGRADPAPTPPPPAPPPPAPRPSSAGAGSTTGG